MKSKFWRRFSRNKGAVFGLIVLMLVALVTALGPFVAQNNPWDMVGTPFAAPMAEQGLLLGTDTMGSRPCSAMGAATSCRASSPARASRC
jgi:peptide/nickel transport system permease protein